jgi:hypothetical protein
MEWTVISDSHTGSLWESRCLWNDPTVAFRERRDFFYRLSDELRAVSTHDGCTVGDNADCLRPGEWIASDGFVIHAGG